MRLVYLNLFRLVSVQPIFLKMFTHQWICRILLFNLLIFSALNSFAHIGSAGVVYEGTAGVYRVLVNVQPPDVIPGTAKVSVMVEGEGITKIWLQPINFWAGGKGVPPPDEAFPLLGESGRYEGMVWFMESGTSSVLVTIEGTKGQGKAVVPVMAVATAKRPMEPWRGWLLVALGLFLVGLMATIIGASMGDSLLKPGDSLNKLFLRKRVMGSVIGTAFCGLVLWGGNTWWNSWANDYERFMYKPYTATSSVREGEGSRILSFKIDTTSIARRWTSYIIPDHGKLMHLFLVRQGTMDVFAHLHPSRKDTVTFEATLPPLPAGKYLAYADIVRFNGFAYTITDTLIIPAQKEPRPIAANVLGDPEDTYVVTNPLNSEKPLLTDATITICGKPGIKTKLQDGSTIVWEEKSAAPLQVGRIYSLKFSILDENNKPAKLDLYLGMMGHAAVIKDDGSVYIHLHPTGTYSSASKQAMENRIADTTQKYKVQETKFFRDSIDQVMAKAQTLNEIDRMKLLMPGMVHEGGHHATVSFPYAFPQAGNYRIWVQIKRNGKVLSGAFDAKVQ